MSESTVPQDVLIQLVKLARSGKVDELIALATAGKSLAGGGRLSTPDANTLRVTNADGSSYVDFDVGSSGNLIIRSAFGRANLGAAVVFNKNAVNIATGSPASIALTVAGSGSLYRCNTNGSTQELVLPGVTDAEGTSVTGIKYRAVVYGGAKAYFRPSNAAHTVLLAGVSTPAATPQWIAGCNPGAAAPTTLDMEMEFMGSNTWKATAREGTIVVTSPGP